MKAVGQLFERIAERDNLTQALWRAARGKRDRPEVASFLRHSSELLREISHDLQRGTYCFAPYRSFPVQDTKTREIHAPSFRDRVVHHAIIGVVGPVMERGALEHSYACRAGKGMHAALSQVRAWMRRTDWYGKMDVRNRWMKGSRLVPRYLRYMDDVVILTNEQSDLAAIRDRARDGLAELQLTLKNGGEWNECRRGLPFLGFIVYPDRLRLGKQGRKRLRRQLRHIESDHARGILTDSQLHDRAVAMFAHACVADDSAWRREVLKWSRWRDDFDECGEQPEPSPGQPGRFVGQHGQELPLGLPQQGQAGAAQSEPGSAGLLGSRHGEKVVLPDVAASRSCQAPAWRDESMDKTPPAPDIPFYGENGAGEAPGFSSFPKNYES